MGTKVQLKQLKSFAKKRSERVVSPAAVPSNAKAAEGANECLGHITTAILALRQSEPGLLDATVVDALRFQYREPGARMSDKNPANQALERVRGETGYETAVWRMSIKSLLSLVDPSHRADRKTTQFLDLLETVAN